MLPVRIQSFMVISLVFCSTSLGSDWDPLDDDVFQGNPYYGPQLATAEVGYLAPGATQPAPTLLIAVTTGGSDVRLYSFDTSSITLELEWEPQLPLHPVPTLKLPTFQPAPD